MLWLAVFRTYDLLPFWTFRLLSLKASPQQSTRGTYSIYRYIQYNYIPYCTYVLLKPNTVHTVYGYRHSSNRAQIIPRKTARSTSQASNFLVARSDPVFSGWVFTFILIASKKTPSIQKTLLWDEYKCKTPSPKGLQKVRKEPPEAPLRCHERPPRLAFQRLEVGFP